MSIFHNYPYTDMHELNLDWIILQIKQLHDDWDDFKVINQIRFYGSWDINKSYPAWALVSVGNIGYISKKPAPAGIPITEIDYWLPVADYSALLADLQQRVSIAENNIVEINEQIDEITTKIDSKKYRKYILLSDSYGMRDTSKPTWTDLFRENIPYVRDMSISGRGFIVEENTFLSSINYYINSLTEQERDEITDIVVCGGWNDAARISQGIATISTLENAIKEFCNTASNSFINAKIWIGFIGWQNFKLVGSTTRAGLISAQQVYNNIVHNNLYHMPNVSCIMKNQNYLDETNFHPNPLGSKTLFEGIWASLNGNYTYRFQQSLTASDITLPTGNLLTFDWEVENDICTVKIVIDHITITSGNNFAVILNNKVPCGLLNGLGLQAMVYGAGYKNLYIGIFAIGENVYMNCTPELNNQRIVLDATFNTMYH